MHKRHLKKPDGRSLYLYSSSPVADGLAAPSPQSEPVQSNPHLRWHPLRGEWVAYASHRQNRTFLPPKEYNPLQPMRDPGVPTELPVGNYEVAVFENLFPSLSAQAGHPPHLGVETAPGKGACEVVVFSQDADASLSTLPLKRIELLMEVWADRTRELGSRPGIQYVMPFENRGVEMGVTLHHPHGQIYSYPFVPPVPARELEQSRAHFEKTGRGLIEDFVARETLERSRLLFESETAAAFVPICARYPYEVWIAPKQRRARLDLMSETERRELARALKTVVMKYDRLWNRPFPYLMVFHQGPTDGVDHPEAHFHIEFYPPYRTSQRLKYLAGTELGAGMFASDVLPEEKAAELQKVEVDVES
jgi:UDPglucose--hexose-1-phosphate uridylyltransferase